MATASSRPSRDDCVKAIEMFRNGASRLAISQELWISLADVNTILTYGTDTPSMSLPGRWVDRAACRQQYVDPDWWFSESQELTEAAVHICESCPVLDECRQWAFTSGDNHAVLGGMTAQERVEERLARCVPE